MNAVPTSAEVSAIVEGAVGRPPARIARFPTGLCHYVYDVQLEDGSQIVARISDHDKRGLLEAAGRWNATLRPRGVPLPAILDANLEGPRPYLILERLPGTDLGNCYASLSAEQKLTLAREIVKIQRAVADLPTAAAGYGYAQSFDDPALKNCKSWMAVLEGQLDRAIDWMQQVGVCDIGHVEKVRTAVRRYSGYFDRIKPTPFLDDTTTKNVIVHLGSLSGLVDVDEICFGDPLFTTALTKMSLLSSRSNGDYIEYWLDCLGATAEQRKAVELYAAIFCVGFMGEIGMAFNKNGPVHIDRDQIRHLEVVLEQLLAGKA